MMDMLAGWLMGEEMESSRSGSHKVHLKKMRRDE